ncbi:MAG: DNA polymerase III subunit delta [Deltaproteobacteria bacterium]|nr:DNA polymerase III subunit delta [Deltaproteobacteria bacterium]
MALKPVYYIFGSDDYLVQEALEGIKKEALTGPFASMNYQAFEAKSLDAGEVISAASTMPAFADTRLVLVKGAESIKAAQLEPLHQYIKNPSSSTCLVFVSDAAKVERNSPFFKTLTEKGYLKPCNTLSERELLAWIKNDAKAQGKTISDTAAQRLLATAGNRLRDIKGELDKIILFVGNAPEVKDSDVEDAGIDCKEETIFGLSDAIAAKDLKRALKIYDKISREPLIKVLGAISRQMRILLKLKALQRKKADPRQYPSALGVPPFVVDNFVRAGRQFTEPELMTAMEKLYRADTDLKTGRLPEQIVFSKLIIELCGK